MSTTGMCFFSPPTVWTDQSDKKQALVHARTVSTFKSTTSACLTKKSEEGREWVPSTLKKSRALPFAAFCFLLVGALEGLNVAIARNQGISPSEKEVLFFIKYLPTFCVVLLGLVWKTVTAEVKKLTPWAAMSGKWAAAEDSVLVNYIDKLEVISVFSAAKRKHWAALMAIAMGFMIGAAVTAANALAYVDLSASIQSDIPMKKLSRFNFDGTLFRRDPNATLAVSMDYTANRPYAAVAAERLVGGQSAAFTSHAYAFDKFASVTEQPPDSTIQANVSAFNVDWSCQKLDYSINHLKLQETTMDKYWQLNASKADTECAQDITQRFSDSNWGDDKRAQYAWLNVTQCTDPTDLRLLATLFVPGADVPMNPKEESKAVGIMCTPRFTIGQALVRTSSSGKVQSYTTDHSTIKEIDIQTSMEAIYYYLVGVNDAMPGEDYGESILKVDWDHTIDLTFVHLTAFGLAYNGFDTFFQSMTDSGMRKLDQSYLENVEIFERETKSLASQTMAQVVSVFARADEDNPEPINGMISLNEPRLLLRHTALRILQAILVVLGIAMVLESSLMRPKPLLKQDPGLLAATAIILARSPSVEQVLSPHAVTSDEDMQKSLASTRWRLREESRGSVSGSVLEVDTSALPAEGFVEAESLRKHPGCRPIALRADVKWIIAGVFCIVIAILGLLQGLSVARKGICPNNTISSSLFDYIPTLALVLLSSSCSALDGATRAMLSYRSLRKPSKKQPLLSNFQDTSTFHALFRPHRKIGRFGFALAAASLATLIFPWIKIVAAGLYYTTTSTITERAILHMDNSLVDSSNSYMDANNAFIKTLTTKTAKFTEWSVMPDFGIGQRPGALDNLLISNLTEWSPAKAADEKAAYEIEARVKAIAVNNHCEAVHSNEFEVLASWSTECGNRTIFEFRCKSAHCRSTLGISERRQHDPVDYMGLGTTPPCFLEPYFGISWWDEYNSTTNVYLSDFSSVMGPVQNYTAINVHKSTVVDSSMFNVSLPSLRAVSCLYNVSAVEADVTFTRSSKLDVGGATISLPWAPSSYNRESIVYRSYLDYLSTGGTLQPGLEMDGSITYSPYSYTTFELAESGLNSTSLWPQTSHTTNLYENLAAYAEYNIGNVNALLDASRLAEAASAMHGISGREQLTSARPFIREAANASSAQAVLGSARRRQTRITQDATTTMVLETLLAVVLACLLWVIVRFPSAAILPKEPNSIAARLSHFAGSGLVRRLRDEGVARVEETAVWGERAGLGWWPRFGAVEEEDSGSDRCCESRLWRWGIDVGPDMVMRDWNQAPFGEGVEGAEASVNDEEKEEEEEEETAEEASDVAAASPISETYESGSAGPVSGYERVGQAELGDVDLSSVKLQRVSWWEMEDGDAGGDGRRYASRGGGSGGVYEAVGQGEDGGDGGLIRRV